MYGRNRSDRLDLHDNAISYNEISTIATIEFVSAVDDRNGLLSKEG